MNEIKYLMISMRPKQWIKNLFVIAALFFSKNMMDVSIVTRALCAFAIFCLFSSSIYLINDILDLEKDKNHPKKSSRPLASGLLSTRVSLLGSLILLSAAVTGSLFLDSRLLVVGLAYWFINLFYTLYLKNLVIIDVICIAIGFVLRIVAGGIAVKVPSSHWVLTTTIFLSLFLGFSKRRGEIALSLIPQKQTSRPVLKNYNILLLDQFLVICATLSIMSYALFSLSDYAFERFGTHSLIYTIPFVVFGVFRYLYLIYTSDYYEDPTETLFIDKPLIFNIILWIILVICIVYV
ncbi:MAG: decaprenyl-phosphate phosphoribosyltransferase [Candidatus Omnitrophica bacterium]|nr:decaprenyl-phosphate phosphoribosyltransferase [Candidatus Omnitrophota bacterium]